MTAGTEPQRNGLTEPLTEAARGCAFSFPSATSAGDAERTKLVADVEPDHGFLGSLLRRSRGTNNGNAVRAAADFSGVAAGARRGFLALPASSTSRQ